jgi:hypothetical protein
MLGTTKGRARKNSEVPKTILEIGQLLIGVLEHFLELRHDENHQEDQDGHGDEHDDHRVDHGGNDLVFEFLGLFLVFGETVEDDFEHTAEFAGLDHVDVELVEDLGVLGEGFGEGGAALDVSARAGRRWL